MDNLAYYELKDEIERARKEAADLQEKINKVISKIHTGDAREGWGGRAAMEVFEILTGHPYP